MALVGASGSGKSSVALSLLKLQKNAKMLGSIFFDGKDIVPCSEEEMRHVRGGKIAMIFQEPMTSLNPVHKVGVQVLESLQLHQQSPSVEKVLELFQRVELSPDLYHSFPHQLSGGQRQRVMIAMALAGNPKLLVADEPTTALDAQTQHQILTLLKKLQKELGLAILFITHDLDVVRSIADRVYVMKFGRIIATKIPEKKPIVSRTVVVPKKSDRPVLQVKNVNVFYDKKQIVFDASFDLYAGQTVALIGESGSGKSSLGQGIARLVRSTGQVLLGQEDFSQLRGEALRRARAKIQFVFQDPASSLNPRMRVIDIIAEGLRVHYPKKTADFYKQEVVHILKDISLSTDVLFRYPHALSGGQRTRVALARALILKPSVLILDEITSSLDIYTSKQIMHLLLDLQEQQKLAYVLITHDLKLVAQMADKIGIVKEGHLSLYTPDELKRKAVS